MKKYTHAWIAFKAIERLESAHILKNKKYADNLIKWFKDHKDGVIQGAWYPDMVIKDMGNSHVLKFTPTSTGENKFRVLPKQNLMYQTGKKSDLYKKPYVIDPNDNLPERCDALTHSIIDNLKMQETEHKGSPISPTDNHIAVRLFMLSHYVADAHMPFHCDSRRFSEGINLHAKVEKLWEDEVKKHFDIDSDNERFHYNPAGYPLNKKKSDYNGSILKRVENEIKNRDFFVTWGTHNGNVRDYMNAVCQYSYLLSFMFIPQSYNETNVTTGNWRSLPGQGITFEKMSFMVLSDAIDAIAKIWLRGWRRYMKWERDKKD